MVFSDIPIATQLSILWKICNWSLIMKNDLNINLAK